GQRQAAVDVVHLDVRAVADNGHGADLLLRDAAGGQRGHDAVGQGRGAHSVVGKQGGLDPLGPGGHVLKLGLQEVAQDVDVVHHHVLDDVQVLDTRVEGPHAL